MKLRATRSLVRPAGTSGDDRVGVLETPSGVLFVLADGAGGTGGGAQAAEQCVTLVLDAVKLREEHDDLFWSHVLTQVDAALLADDEAGESTAVVVECRHDRFCGASVGDSGSILLVGGQANDLTARQIRKSLLGSGEALPMPFVVEPATGTLVLASDGLWKYAPLAEILGVLRGSDLRAELDDLARLVQMPSGGLQDDLAVIIAECIA